MANLVLSAAGGAVAGPVGSAFGSFLGRQIDRGLRGRSPARLTDLRLQSSQYGDAVPAVHGRMRVAGIVLWTSELVPTAMVSKTGSGTSYQVSFAVSLSSVPIGGVGRIWADGRLIRDVDGVQSVAFGLRVHKGEPDQEVDGIILADLGADQATAFRDFAYAVLEDFDLSTFGSRLPQLTFEVNPDAGVVDPSALIADALGIEAGSGSDLSVFGLTLMGDDQDEALAPLVRVLDQDFGHSDGDWVVGDTGTTHLIDPTLWDVGHLASPAMVGSSDASPTKVSLRFFDAERDFAGSEKSARLPGRETLLRIDVPAAFSGETAELLARRNLARRWQRASRSLRLPSRFAAIDIGDQIGSADNPDQLYRISHKLFEKGEVVLALREDRRPSLATASTLPVVQARSLATPSLQLALMESPWRDGANSPAVLVVAAGPTRVVGLRVEAGTFSEDVSVPSTAGTIGFLSGPVSETDPALIDWKNGLEVCFPSDPILTSCELSRLGPKTNLVAVHGEMIQFLDAEYLGEGAYRLRGLLRARFETTMPPAHASGSRVVVLRSDTCREVALPLDTVGSTVNAYASAIDGTEIVCSLGGLVGNSLRPWRPVLLTCEWSGGQLDLQWLRRSPSGQAWLDNVDVPLGVSRERYVVTLADNAGGVVSKDLTAPSASFAPAELASLSARPWTLEVRQVGDLALGLPLTVQLS